MIALLLQVTLHAEPFPPGPPVPGYAAVRIRIASPEATGGTLHLRAGESATEAKVEIPAGGGRDVVLAVWRAASTAIEVDFAGRAAARVDPGPPRSAVLCIGALAEAEAASDAFGCSLPEVVALAAIPELLDPMALDGFGGVMPAGLPGDLVSARLLRGGAVGEGPRSAASLPAELAGLLPAAGLRPRDLFGLSAAPVRIATAAAILLSFAAFLLARKPRVALATGGGAAAIAVLAIGLTSREPSIQIARLGRPDLVLRGAGTSGRIGDRTSAVYPCAAGGIVRALDASGVTWSSETVSLLASIEPAGPALEETAAPSLRSAAARALAIGSGLPAAIDPAAGILVLRGP